MYTVFDFSVSCTYFHQGILNGNVIYAMLSKCALRKLAVTERKNSLKTTRIRKSNNVKNQKQCTLYYWFYSLVFMHYILFYLSLNYASTDDFSITFFYICSVNIHF